MTVRNKVIHNPSGYHSHGKTHKEKVINFSLFIKEFGWSGTWNDDEESGILYMHATRGKNEKIDIEWPEKQWWPDVWYTYAGNSIKCRNISQAAKIGQEPPDSEKMRAASRRLRRSGKPGIGLRGPGATGRPLPGEAGTDEAAADLIEELATSLPFDHESSPAEIKAVLKGRYITWVNTLSGATRQALVKPGKHYKVTTTKEDKIVIEFADDHGFHSVYASSIIGVG